MQLKSGAHAAVAILVLAFEPTAWAATKVFLHNATSAYGTLSNGPTRLAGTCAVGNNNYKFRLANSTQGASAVTVTWQPTLSGTAPCYIQNGTGGATSDYLIWMSPPLSSAVTISGNIDYNFWAKESQNGMNASIEFTILRWSLHDQGIVSTVQVAGFGAEMSTSIAAAKTIAAAAPTSTAFAAGDRIVITVEIVNPPALTLNQNGTRTVTLAYDGTSGASGDSYVNFADTFTFSSDAPPPGISQ
jgi:hypothetical protein